MWSHYPLDTRSNRRVFKAIKAQKINDFDRIFLGYLQIRAIRAILKYRNNNNRMEHEYLRTHEYFSLSGNEYKLLHCRSVLRILI